MCCQEEETQTLLDIYLTLCNVEGKSSGIVWSFESRENFATFFSSWVECGLILLTDAGFSQRRRFGLAGSEGRWPTAECDVPSGRHPWSQSALPAQQAVGLKNLLRRGLLSAYYRPVLVAMIKQTKNKNVSWVSVGCVLRGSYSWTTYSCIFWFFTIHSVLSLQNNWKSCSIFASLLIRSSGLTDYRRLLWYISIGFWCSCTQWLFQREA